MVGQYFRVNAPQVKALTAGQYGHRQFTDFRCCENELYMRRRLFERFQQCVKRRRRQHVHFVDDINFVARFNRRIADALYQFANIADAGSRSRIHLKNIRVAALGDRAAMQAFLRHVHLRSGIFTVRPHIIQGPGENARRRCFADAAHARQNISVGDAI